MNATKTSPVYAYARVSTIDQNEGRQEEELKRHGYSKGKLYTDKASGRDTNRPELQALLKAIPSGASLVVYSMDRLARSLKDLQELIEKLTAEGVTVKFLKEGMTFTGEENAMARFQLQMLGAVAELERNLIKERQREGIALAKARGVYRGRKAKLTPEQITAIKERISSGEKKAALAREYSISRETLYKAIAE